MRQKQEKIRNKFMKDGVTLVAPETIFLSSNIRFGKNVVINPYVVIGSKVKIGSNVEILSFTHIENATIENNVKVGPFSRIRPGAILSKGSKVGNFVEIKNSRVGARSKINHLSYVGDTTIGKSTNIGAGTITCNYDGKRKNRTKIQDEVFIGSNSSLVAPVTIGKKSVIGAGSVITKNVRKGSLVLARAKQIEKKKYK
ncbi:MAG: UDP-N-acetylglucosamine pyrophosphorylase [Pelagibacteraceae bacterium]|jgi:bifunctional UDP-N-acetylglucosamine pyrophosphorylase/glucosamine-1-phosphate N-acetyltransferase|nr:UDP-N-acetylglucosamine pyrophosphorylase [Pelagibacteraceae bacterium]